MNGQDLNADLSDSELMLILQSYLGNCISILFLERKMTSEPNKLMEPELTDVLLSDFL